MGRHKKLIKTIEVLKSKRGRKPVKSVGLLYKNAFSTFGEEVYQKYRKANFSVEQTGIKDEIKKLENSLRDLVFEMKDCNIIK